MTFPVHYRDFSFPRLKLAILVADAINYFSASSGNLATRSCIKGKDRQEKVARQGMQ